MSGPHLDLETKSRYISIYEVEAASYEEAERILNEWQANPEAWAGRANHMQTMEKFGSIPMKINGSGWYEELKVFKSEELKNNKGSEGFRNERMAFRDCVRTDLGHRWRSNRSIVKVYAHLERIR